MFSRHVTKHLSAYLHGELRADKKQRVEAHLPDCEYCRKAYDEVRLGIQLMSNVSKTPAPESLWRSMQAKPRTLARKTWIPRLATAAIVTVLSLGLVWFFSQRNPTSPSSGPSWVVENLRGTPRIGDSDLQQQGELQPGETLHTDSESQAEVRIADIGRLYVEPDTRLRLLVTKADEHRISLEQGKVEALTWAPPRLFIVDTPSATAVDLGCRYTLEVEKDGSSLLHVTLGMVSLENDGRATFVPANFLARTRHGAGPGTPFRDGSSQSLVGALDVIDFGQDNAARDLQAAAILAEASSADAVTLWHLLPRVGSQVRNDIFKRLALFVPPPKDVTPGSILSLDSKMLRAWGESIPGLEWMKHSESSQD